MKTLKYFRRWFDTISRILIADKLPYLFTILIAITAYQLDHIISNVSETPIIEYGFSILNSKDSAGFKVDSIKVTIRNLNKKTAFKNLEFDIKYRSGRRSKPTEVYDADLIPISPAPILPDSDAYSWRSQYNHYKIPQLQPDGEYWAILKIRDKKELNNMPMIYLSSSDNVWLTESNMETFVIRNQIWINIVLIALSFFMMILYANHMNNAQTSTSNEI